MTPTEYSECLNLIGWTQRGLAERLGVHETRTRRWASGKYSIPANVAAWLDRLAAAHTKHPLPNEWRPENKSPMTQNSSCIETQTAS